MGYAGANAVKKHRLDYLMAVADKESLSYDEIAEVQDEYDKIPDDKLRDLRDNASVIDMLLDIEAQQVVKTSDGRRIEVVLVNKEEEDI